MPHAIDSSSNSSAASSDLPTASTGPSSNGSNSPTKQPARQAHEQEAPGTAGSNIDGTKTVKLPFIRSPSHEQLIDRTKPYMATQRNGAGPASRQAMTEEERRPTLNADPYRRSSYYPELFIGYAPNQVPQANEQIRKGSPVIAELRTNVIIKDEFTLITSLSTELAARYHRTDSCIMVSLAHSSCLMFGGSFDPAYILTISTIPDYLRINEHTTFLIQRFMADILSVPPARGILRFVAIPEDMLGTKGTTIRAQIAEADPALTRSSTGLSNHRRSTLNERRLSLGPSPANVNRNLSMKSVRSIKQQGQISPPMPIKAGALQSTSALTRPSASGVDGGRSRPTTTNGSQPIPALAINGTAVGRHPSPAPSTRPSSSKKSALKMTGQSDTSLVVPSPPPIPENLPTTRINKRKSLVSLFKKEKATAA